MAAEPDYPAGAPPGAVLAISPLLGRRVRAGTWEEQSVSTYTNARQAAAAGRFDTAAEYADFFMDEARIINGLVTDLVAQFQAFLVRRGTPEQEVAAARERILGLIRMPDGSDYSQEREFARTQEAVRRFIVACGAGDPARCAGLADEFKETWRAGHDRMVDLMCGLIAEIQLRFGEEAVGDLHRETMQHLFNGRYATFDIHTMEWTQAVEALLYLTFEAMRAHLVGPARDGTMEFVDEGDRFVVRFDPCGTGGRTLRPDEVEGTPPRPEPPYSWPVLQEEHDWAWNTKGVCSYCAHCCMVMERLPIERFGYPLRVVLPPTYPREANSKCAWMMYKDPTAVPEEYYRRVGLTKPAGLGADRTPSKPVDPDHVIP